MDALDIGGEPLPILWTADFIPVDNHVAPYVIGEFNCACVSINKFAAAAGADLKAVGSADMAEGYKLTKLMGKKVNTRQLQLYCACYHSRVACAWRRSQFSGFGFERRESREQFTVGCIEISKPALAASF